MSKVNNFSPAKVHLHMTNDEEPSYGGSIKCLPNILKFHEVHEHDPGLTVFPSLPYSQKHTQASFLEALSRGHS